MNELSLLKEQEKLVTTKELAEVLGVSIDTVTRVANKVIDPSAVLHRVINGGKSKVFTEEQSTLIKLEIQKHHNLSNRQVDNVTTEYEMELMTQKVIQYHILKANEYKQRMEAAESVVNRISNSSGLKTIKEVADILGYGEKSYFALLRGEGILFKDNGVNLPKRQYIDSGYFEVKEEPYERNGKDFVYSRVYVTAKGLLWLEKKTPKRA